MIDTAKHKFRVCKYLIIFSIFSLCTIANGEYIQGDLSTLPWKLSSLTPQERNLALSDIVKASGALLGPYFVLRDDKWTFKRNSLKRAEIAEKLFYLTFKFIAIDALQDYSECKKVLENYSKQINRFKTFKSIGPLLWLGWMRQFMTNEKFGAFYPITNKDFIAQELEYTREIPRFIKRVDIMPEQLKQTLEARESFLEKKYKEIVEKTITHETTHQVDPATVAQTKIKYFETALQTFIDDREDAAQAGEDYQEIVAKMDTEIEEIQKKFDEIKKTYENQPQQIIDKLEKLEDDAIQKFEVIRQEIDKINETQSKQGKKKLVLPTEQQPVQTEEKKIVPEQQLEKPIEAVEPTKPQEALSQEQPIQPEPVIVAKGPEEPKQVEILKPIEPKEAALTQPADTKTPAASQTDVSTSKSIHATSTPLTQEQRTRPMNIEDFKQLTDEQIMEIYKTPNRRFTSAEQKYAIDQRGLRKAMNEYYKSVRRR